MTINPQPPGAGRAKEKEMNKELNKKEIVERISAAVKLVKKSGSPDANTACTARAAAIVKLLALVRDLNS